MSLTQQDNNILAKVLENKMSEKDINKVIDLANKKSFYYGLKDSPLNRPTLAKVVALLVFIACISIFAVIPLFFGEKANVTNLANSLVEDSLNRGGVPPISSFQYSVKLTNAGAQGGETKQVLEIIDNQGNLISKADIINGHGVSIFGKLSENMQISAADREKIMNMSRFQLEDDKKTLIKDFLDNSLEYASLIPEVKPIDYGVDTLINASAN